MTGPERCHLSALGLVTALGRGKEAVATGLFRGTTTGLVLEEGWLPEGPARVGRVPGQLEALPARFADDDSRNTRLLLAALGEIQDEVDREISRHGRHRIGVVLGTSTSGIEASERALAHALTEGSLPPEFHYRQQEIGRLAPFLAEYLGLTGPALTVSTACTSSGKALVTARNLLRLGLCDAVITGGSDSLCKLTLNGFASLESATATLCNPLSRNRCGINVGEAAVLFLLRREPAEVALLGAGASSDAHHISSPEPSGRGAEAAMRAALAEAGLRPGGIGYLNLHATATLKNDEMESLATARVFPDGVPCSGTKPLTGHALGASAAAELAFGWLALHPRWNPERRLPPHRWDGEADPALPALRLTTEASRLDGPRVCMSNAFAFGGNNLSLIIGATP
ncbi:MAG: beta-ketoacyl-[acyl-carrier-protein] synthase family protein [Geothrix sp.]|uniref:beta-ketoacyl-[acyl-carrier-protein] synthase family protein n=1 Tax=Geothrix sp. TaxID=1962974 RepID=UPI00180D06BB|nr:beta-ketoacyl-[acyl-carrier-protein] synthase family protein [Geothrix sp.]NWJ41188.1 beta-ketoacyl-[acyl-carrier-protein] synthase family protein [Geothrix sp.]WIL20821.1 MAG: beta-ketoacyl-[acyl-carrier-protein] synthase family protein [Geothrix sp.]